MINCWNRDLFSEYAQQKANCNLFFSQNLGLILKIAVIRKAMKEQSCREKATLVQ